VKFSEAVDLYVGDMKAQGRIGSPRTERSYRGCLDSHADDVGNRDPRYTNRDDVKRTLRRWANPNTQRVRRAVLVSFYDWTMEEGLRKDNPARQTRSPRRRPTKVYRLTGHETARLLDAAIGTRERRVIFLGICAGLRNAELRGLQGRHFQREGWVWVSEDIAKGHRERWVPVLPDLVDVVHDIRTSVHADEYVLPAERWRDPGQNRVRTDLKLHPCSSQALRSLVMRVAKRAGIQQHIHPHVMRHAFGDHVARYAGMRNAQFLLGHATVGTTETYVGEPTLDELAASVRGLGFGGDKGTSVLGPREQAGIPHEAPTGIEPVPSSLHGAEPSFREWLERNVADSVRLHLPRFEEAARV
jgi:integrase/recombinase XerC